MKNTPFNTLAYQGVPTRDVQDQLKDMIYDRTELAIRKGIRKKAKIKDLKTLNEYQLWVRKTFNSSLGNVDYPQSPLNIQWLDTIECETYDLIHLVFESRPKHYVTANLYRPKKYQQHLNAGILLACGHQKQAKDSEEYQGVAQTLVNQDLVVLVIDPIGQGERFSYIHPETQELMVEPVTFEHDTIGYQTQSLGYSIAKPMLHDHLRAIDVLQSLPYVDPQKIGVTGNSGGGTMTSMLMMVDDRIQASAPATFITHRSFYQQTGQAQDREQHWKGLSEYGLDHDDILIAFAPKPCLVLAAEYDFFPIEGTRFSFESAQRMYDLYSKSTNLQLSVQAIEHSYPPSMALKAAEFFRTVFYPNDTPIKNVQNNLITHDSRTRVTKQGQVLLSYQDARTVYMDNQDRRIKLQKVRATLISQGKWSSIDRFLTKNIYRNRVLCDFNPKRFNVMDTLSYTFEQWVYQSQLDMVGAFFWFKPKQEHKKLVVCYWDQGTAASDEHIDWIQDQLKQGSSVVVVDLSGMGQLTQRDLVWWAKAQEWYGSLYKLNDDLLWLNDSLAALRSFEVIRSLELIKRLDPKVSLHLYSEGSAYVFVSIANAVQHTPYPHEHVSDFVSYDQWIQNITYPPTWGYELGFPDILSYTDIDELVHDTQERMKR